MERICVAIRIKPTSRQETSNGAQWKVVANNISLHNAFGSPVKGQTYAFDKIFGTSVRNAEVYDEHTKDLVLSAVSGFNGTVFAYGQTSSGKTYTMQGSPSDQGVTRLAIQDVFTNIEKIEDREFLVRVSYMEIYNEEINDLLAPDNRKLQIHESVERGIFVAGLREEIADSVEQVIAVLERGEAQRHFAETDMNVNSSRSHTIFRMVIESRDRSLDSTQDNDLTAQDSVRVSALNLVDLAGSERISKTGAEGVRLKEGAHINKSLTTLGIVINKLSEGGGKQGAHIPYRDSKLTRILQLALGGNARTAIICTINPDEIHIDETRGTLQFASRAKRVTNCAQVNETLTDAALLKRQKEEIKELKRRLEESPHSKGLKKEILLLRNDLLKIVSGLEERTRILSMNELGRERLELELQQELRAQVERERRIKEQEHRIENLSTMVISGATEDRDIPIRKGYRRKTWCPLSISNTFEQGLRRINSGRNKFAASASIDNNLRHSATRRDRAFGLPPAFESLINDESDSFWSNSSGTDSLPVSAEFQNFADEDTWASLNRDPKKKSMNSVDEDDWGNVNEGHVNTDYRVSNALPNTEFRRGSRQVSLFAEDSSTSDMLKDQLHDMNLLYEDLQSSTEFKIQEKSKEAVAAANNALLEETSRFQLQEIVKLNSVVKDLKVELENCNEENNRLKTETMNLHSQILHTRAALEQRVQERVSVDEENVYFKQRLRSLEMRIDDNHYPQLSGECCLGGDFARDELGVSGVSGICAKCQLSTEMDDRPSSMQCVENSTFRKISDENQDNHISELSMPKVYKRRLFDDKDNVTSENHEGKDQYWNKSRKRFVPGNAADPDDIPAALGRLFCRAKQLADLSSNRTESGSMQDLASDETNNQKESLHRAYRLAKELLHELYSIVNHDVRCIEDHVASDGNSMKTLQLLLLENADIGLRLFYYLSLKESTVLARKFQVLHEVAENRAIGHEDGIVAESSSANYSDGLQLRQNDSVFSEDSKAVHDSAIPAHTWNPTLVDAPLPSSQDPGEDICNIDLHQDCDEGAGMESNCPPSASLDSQVTDEPCVSQMSHEYLPNAQIDENIEELKMMQNMSEAEKQFTTALLNKVRALEARLTVAEMEVVEYKVEIEHLRVNKLEVSQNSDDSELQALRVECETQKEEIRQLIEQVMTPDDELERESLFRETMERNNFLENCLMKAERRLIRAKGWREELLQIRETESRREKAYHNVQARNAVLEKESVQLRQDRSKGKQSLVSKSGEPIEYLDEVTKLEILNEAESLNLQVLLSVGPTRRAILSTPPRKMNTTPARTRDETELPKGSSCRPPRLALGEIHKNVVQPCTPKDLRGYICQCPDIGKLPVIDTSDKENQLCPQGLIMPLTDMV